MWIYTQKTMRGPRAWITSMLAVGGWLACTFGCGWAAVYFSSASTHVQTWFVLMWMAAVVAGLCVAPAGAVEIWNVLRGKCSEAEVDDRRHKAGVITAWVIGIGIAIGIAWAFRPHPAPTGLEVFVWIATFVGYIVASYSIDEIGRLRMQCAQNEARVAQLEREIEALGCRATYHDEPYDY